MNHPLSITHHSAAPLPWGVLIVVCVVACSLLNADWGERTDNDRPAMQLRGDSSGEVRPAVVRSSPAYWQVSQKIEERGGKIAAKYEFINFNDDPLRVTYSLPVSDLSAYRQSYGYADADLESLNGSQAEALLRSRGFVRVKDGVYAVDIPEIVKRNITIMHPVSQQLADSGSRLGYGSDELISAALSLVQTAVRYEIVPGIVNGRRTGGIYPPADTLLRGKGDCDTKSALLASILLNWNRVGLVGVSVPNHYLLGILRNPLKGDVFVEFKGLKYVLMEPSGPAWVPPGKVGSYTKSILKTGTGIKIEQITANN